MTEQECIALLDGYYAKWPLLSDLAKYDVDDIADDLINEYGWSIRRLEAEWPELFKTVFWEEDDD